MRCTQAGPVLALFFSIAVSVVAFAQAQMPTMQLPPFPDKDFHGRMTAILHQMDAFSGDSAMALIAPALHDLKASDREQRYYLLSYRAEVLYYEGLFNEAMRDLDIVEKLAFALNDSLLIANALNMKGLLHENVQGGQLAIPFLRRALQWFPKAPACRYPLSELYHIHGNLGNYLTSVPMPDSAAYHLRRSLELAESAGNPRPVAVACWALGNLYMRTGRLEAAEAYYQRAFTTASNAKDHDVALDASISLCGALIAQNKLAQAREAVSLANDYLKEHGRRVGAATHRNYARQASAAYEALGDAKNALAQAHEWRTLDSTIAAKNTRQALATQAELIKADNNLELERSERERMAEIIEREHYKRRVWAVGATLLLLAITGVYLTNASRQRNKRKLAESEATRAQQENTINELRVRDQIGRDLHDDLGVGLSGLKLRSEMALRTETDPQKKEQLTRLASTAGELIGSMRQIIWSMNTDQASTEDLVVYICNYARTFCAENSLQLTVSAPGPWPVMTLSAEQRRNMFLVVKEAMHNIVKHSQASSVQLIVQWKDGLLVELQDNGIGLPKGTDKAVGNGLRNMRKRISSLGGEFQMNGEVGTRIHFHVPLRSGP